MTRLRDWLTAAGVLLLARRRLQERRQDDRMVAAGAPDRRAETLVVVLLVLAAIFAAGFVVVYALDRLPRQTQLLGAALALSLGSLAAASILVGRRLVVAEEIEEEYPEPDPKEQEAVVRIVEESGTRFTRRKLLLGAAGAAGGALALALVTPVASLGPVFDTGSLYRTPWARGRRLVDANGRPLRAEEIEEGTFYTAFPEAAQRERLGAPVVVVRLRPDLLELPAGRGGWAPAGILAYSKICTHAGCAVSLYRTPRFPPVQERPALVCPCHYSTFDPAAGGAVLFGPAGRPLPQLPLLVDAEGELRAAGSFSDPVGPSWWGVRMGEAR